MDLELDLPTVLLVYKTALIAGALSIFHVSRHACQPRHLPLEPRRQGDVVGIHARDEIGAGLGDPEIQRRDEAVAGTVEQPDPGVLGRMARGDGSRPVAGTVIDHKQFEIREALPADAVDRLVEIRLAVADRQQHRQSDHAGLLPGAIPGWDPTRPGAS